MSQTKAQLVAPVGVVTATAMNVSGVLTATTFDGSLTGAATSIVQGKNLNVGVVTASGIAGDITGSATSITQGTNVTFGSLTATFVGDFTGTASSIMPGSNVTAGVVTASSFSGPVTGTVTGNLTGNVTGTAGSITSGNNLWVGVATATMVGDGSNLTGIAASAFTHQTVTANSGTTSIDLSAGNIITFNQSASTTVSFANTSEAMDITLIRDKDNNSTARAITWPDSVKWNGGSAPTLISDAPADWAKQQFRFLTRDSGVTWYAWESYKNEANNWSLFSWGLNQVGELGQNAAGYPATMLSSPTQVGTDTDWSILEGTSGNNNTSLSLKSDGTLWMWGSNSNGKLAQNNGSTNARLSSPTQVGTDTNWSYVQGNRTAIFGTKTDGSLWSWGYNLNGQLGQNNTSTNLSSPTQIGTETTWGTKTYQLGSTWMHGAAIKTDGTLWMWGVASFNGELAQNNITNYSSPRQVGTGTNWRSVGGGYGAVLATQTNGTLWAWGYGSYGALGLNSVTQRSSPCQVGTDTTWSEVTSYGGYSSVAVLKTDGTLWSWGGNANGQLGLNDRNLRSSPCQIPGTTWKRFDSGDNDCMGAVKTDGTLWTWGINGFGELGQNNLVRYSSPTQVGTGTEWHEVSVNTGTFLALKAP